MLIKKLGAKIVKNSRGDETIAVWVKTSKGKFVTSAPSGKSTGRYEVKPYKKNLVGDVSYINSLEIGKLNFEIFEDLKKVERLVESKLGGNSLFVLEASLLKAIAKENGKELWEVVNPLAKDKASSKSKDLEATGTAKILRSVGNAIGGGLHSKGVKGKKPDFQEFHFIANGKTFSESVKINEMAYKLAGKLLKAKRRNDEGAWETGLSNEEVLDIMNDVKEIINNKGLKVDVGLDVAASSFYKKNYNYKNPKKVLTKKEQIDYISKLIKKYNIFYVEDALDENDFSGFSKLLKKVKGKMKAGTGSKDPVGHLIVGDDLTTTNPSRLKKAIKNKSINAIIVKPNQIGSLLKVKEVIDMANKAGIKTVMSHRSGETKDNTIADLAVGWQVDFIKTGIYGKVRKVKLNRIIKIMMN